jgi:hypothetical protein
MTDLSYYYPERGEADINGGHYKWDFVSRSVGLLLYSANGEQPKNAHLSETHADFKDYLENRAQERANGGYGEPEIIKSIEQVLGHKIEDHQREAYGNACQYLHAEGSVFLTFCSRLVFDYHALDRSLTQTALLSMTRARYSMPSSALLHLDCTGSSGAGKNDLVSRVAALIPSDYLELFSTVSPTALQYRTIERVRDNRTGKIVDVRTNKDTYKGQIIIITEVADAAGHSALKALAETEEQAEYTHMATVNGVAIDMTITGPRCVITTSVEGVNDAQVKRRFIHGSVSEDTLENKEKKLELIETLLKGHKDIRDDPRLPIAQAGIDLIFSTQAVVFEEVEDDAWALIQELNALFLEAGYGLTSIKQFFSLCECIALWKRFNRGYTRVEVEDVQEAWYLLATFERETITKTSRQGIETLRAIKRLCAEYDELYELNPQIEHEPTRPTRREVVKESEVSQAHVYRLLQSKPNESGQCGELIELGYVRDVESNGQLAVELTALGQTVLGEVPNHAIANMEEHEPKEPILPDDVDLEDRLPSLDTILTILTDSHAIEKNEQNKGSSI